MTAQPLEARCDHCHQTRPLFRYRPEHTMHLLPVACRWCDRPQQPLLCVRCWGKERELEETTPATPEEQSIGNFLTAVMHRSARHEAQTAADRATCEGIAQATKEAGS